MTLVVDCSALVDLLVARDQEAIHSVVGGEGLHAPSHVDVEAVNALRGLILGRHLSKERAQDALEDLDDLVIHRWPLDHWLAKATLALAENVTAYDAAYVVLAQSLGCPLLTRDRRLARAVDGIVDVRTV